MDHHPWIDLINVWKQYVYNIHYDNICVSCVAIVALILNESRNYTIMPTMLNAVAYLLTTIRPEFWGRERLMYYKLNIIDQKHVSYSLHFSRLLHCWFNVQWCWISVKYNYKMFYFSVVFTYTVITHQQFLSQINS